jgi:hypothetical protein
VLVATSCQFLESGGGGQPHAKREAVEFFQQKSSEGYRDRNFSVKLIPFTNDMKLYCELFLDSSSGILGCGACSSVNIGPTYQTIRCQPRRLQSDGSFTGPDRGELSARRGLPWRIATPALRQGNALLSAARILHCRRDLFPHMRTAISGGAALGSLPVRPGSFLA